MSSSCFFLRGEIVKGFWTPFAPRLQADGGLKKKILTKGEGSLRPEAGDEVTGEWQNSMIQGFEQTVQRAALSLTTMDFSRPCSEIAYWVMVSWKSFKMPGLRQSV